MTSIAHPQSSAFWRWPSFLVFIGIIAFLLFGATSAFDFVGDSVELRALLLFSILFLLSVTGLTSFVSWRRRTKLVSHPRHAGLINAWLVICVFLFAAILLVFGAELRGALLTMNRLENYRNRTVRFDAAKNEIVIEGLIGPGLAKDVANLLRAHPGVTRLAITSNGGIIDDATETAQLIERHHLDTVAIEYCDSACLIVFMAGRARFAEQDMSFGFHATALVGPETMGSLANLRDEGPKADQYLRKRGVPQAILDKANAIGPGELFYVTAREMAKQGMVTGLLTPACITICHQAHEPGHQGLNGSSENASTRRSPTRRAGFAPK